MKKIILIVLLSLGAVAQAAPVSEMKTYLPDGIWKGTDSYSGNSAKKCQIEAKWLSDQELKVTVTTQYKESAPSITEIIFSDAKLATVERDELNETDDELSLTQGGVSYSEGDYQVEFTEQVVLELVDGHKLESIGINLYEYDNESDPHEDILDCRQLTRIK